MDVARARRALREATSCCGASNATAFGTGGTMLRIGRFLFVRYGRTLITELGSWKRLAQELEAGTAGLELGMPRRHQDLTGFGLSSGSGATGRMVGVWGAGRHRSIRELDMRGKSKRCIYKGSKGGRDSRGRPMLSHFSSCCSCSFRASIRSSRRRIKIFFCS
jgi:hypothetical protein